MTQQSLSAEGRTPNWIADLVVGGTAALLAITVAQASLPEPGARIVKLDAAAPAAAAAETAAAATPAEPAGLVFGEPVPGYPVISPFGLRKLPWEEYGRLHQGVDIAAPAGTPVRAIADGVVVQAGSDGAYGRYVELRHADGLTSFYAHLGGFAREARPGVAVKRGDPIGQIGSTGSSTGAHLHLEVRRGGRALNPDYFIGKTYASAEDIPFRQATHVPRRVRIAYVSHIPKSRREEMEAREAAKALAEEEARLAKLAAEEARKAKAQAQAEARLANLTRLPAARPEGLDVAQAMPAKPDAPAPAESPARGEAPAARSAADAAAPTVAVTEIGRPKPAETPPH